MRLANPFSRARQSKIRFKDVVAVKSNFALANWHYIISLAVPLELIDVLCLEGTLQDDRYNWGKKNLNFARFNRSIAGNETTTFMKIPEIREIIFLEPKE